MSKPIVVFSTLYPAEVGKQRELDNTLKIIQSSKKYWNEFDVVVEAGSAYEESCGKVLDALQERFPKVAERSEIVHCPFELTHEMTERRGHEISFSKRFLMERQVEKKAPDRYLVFIDSDVLIDFEFIRAGLLKLFDQPKSFVQIPYVLRDVDATPPDQLGAFIVPTRFLDKGSAETMYQTAYTENGKLKRIGAPDCRLVRYFLRSLGLKKIRLDDCMTQHFDVEKIAIYDHGTIRRKSWR
jgi:hypothetical protein